LIQSKLETTTRNQKFKTLHSPNSYTYETAIRRDTSVYF